MVNTKALEAAGVTETTNVVGGKFLRDEDGKLTGMCYERGAINLVLNALSPTSTEVADDYLKDALNLYGREGFTTISVTGVGGVTPDAVSRLRTLTNDESCPVRVVAYLDEDAMKVEDAGVGGECVPSKPSVAGFAHMGVHFRADGFLYTEGMAVEEPFTDCKMTLGLEYPPSPRYGNMTYDYDSLHMRMQEFHRRYFQLCCQAYGQRAIDQVLDIYETIFKDEPRDDHRYRLEHCALIRKDQIQRAKDLGVYLSFYADRIRFYASFLKNDILGPERVERIMPFKSALEAGHEASAHCDTPYTHLGIMRVINTIVTRAMHLPTEEYRGRPPRKRSSGSGPRRMHLYRRCPEAHA